MNTATLTDILIVDGRSLCTREPSARLLLSRAQEDD